MKPFATSHPNRNGQPSQDVTSAAMKRDRRLQHERLEGEARSAARTPAKPTLSPTADNPAPSKVEVTGLGQRLDLLRQKHYERRYAADLSRVRIHDDLSAARQNDELDANAFTQGDHVVLGRDSDPDSAKGEQLLAHELAHVAQQQQPGATPTLQYDRRTPEGIGASPPDAPYTLMEGTGAEDGFVLFPQDNAELDRQDRNTIAQLVGHPSHPITVHVHGYASQDGGEEYNRNLSAHRAVAVKAYIEGLVPEGSRVIAYAHGEVTAFGNLNANRRVGIDILDASETAGSETGTLGYHPGALNLGAPRFDLDLRLNLDLLHALTPVIPTDPSLGSRIMAPLPQLPGTAFDVGAIAPYYSQRGVSFPQRDARNYEAHFNTWRDRFMLWGLAPDLAATLAQIGTEAAAQTQLSIDYPTRTERLDRMMGTEPTIVPVSDIMIWLFEQAR